VNRNPQEFWRNLDGKGLAIGGGAVLLGWALLDNAYHEGVRTGLMLARQGGEGRWREFDHGFSFGPWLFIAAIVAFVGLRKGWWGGGDGNRPSGPNGYGKSVAPPAWSPTPPAPPTVPPPPTSAPSQAASSPAPPVSPAWSAQPQPQPRPRPAEVRIPVTVAGQASAPPAPPIASTAPQAPMASPPPATPPVEPPPMPTATPEASAPEYRRTVGEAG
jgi:hypothetical protein